MPHRFERAHRAVAFLERHQLDPTTANYDLALHYVSSPGSELARDVDDRTDGGLRLTQEAAHELSDRYLAHSPHVAIRQREQRVAEQTSNLGSLTCDAHELTSALGRDVDSMVSKAGGWPDDAHRFVARLSTAERELADLREEVDRLQSAIGGGEQRRPESDRDQLTQALNQEGAVRRLDQLGASGRNYIVAMFGLDDLLAINDRYGRLVGDNVLRALAATLEQTFPEEQVFRWSGNEFIVILPDMTLGNIRMLSQEALAAFEARRLRLRGSGEWIGVVTASTAIVPGHGEPPNDVLAHARENLATALAEGGNRIVE